MYGKETFIAELKITLDSGLTCSVSTEMRSTKNMLRKNPFSAFLEKYIENEI